MSTTIYILPVETIEITFGQVISLSEKHINSFLKSVGIKKEIELNVNVHDNNRINSIKTQLIFIVSYHLKPKTC